jgi:hypothetical protein
VKREAALAAIRRYARAEQAFREHSIAGGWQISTAPATPEWHALFDAAWAARQDMPRWLRWLAPGIARSVTRRAERDYWRNAGDVTTEYRKPGRSRR